MDKKLLQIKLNAATHKELENFSNEMGYTLTEVIKFSVAFFRWAAEKQKAGYDIYAVPNKENELTEERVQLLLPL